VTDRSLAVGRTKGHWEALAVLDKPPEAVAERATARKSPDSSGVAGGSSQQPVPHEKTVAVTTEGKASETV